MHRLRRSWGRFRWLALAVVFVGSFVLGWVGWMQQDDTLSAVDALYLDFRLLSISSAVTSPNNLALDVARFLVPVVVGYSALAALLTLFRDRALALRAGFARNHVIVAGVGDTGYRFARAALDQGLTAVVIDRDPANPYLVACRREGIHTVIGDATDAEVLAQARLDHARRLVIVCADDAANARVAAEALQQVSADRRTRLRCLIQVEDPELSDLLQARQLRLPPTSQLRFDFFSVAGTGAQLLAGIHPPDLSVRSPTIALVGRDDLWSPFAIEVALRWVARAEPGRRLRLVLVGSDAERRAERLRTLLQVAPECLTVDAVELDDEVLAAGVTVPLPATSAVYLRLARDTETVATALAFDDALDRGIPIVACLTNPAGIATLVADEGGDASRLVAFELLPRLCSPDRIETTALETLARAVHEHYVTERDADGEDPAENPSMVPWDDLPEFLRGSNRDQAAHMADKLRLIGCELVPCRPGELGPFELRDDEVERLAVLEHDRWMADRGRSPDPAARASPWLVPWDQLPEEIRDRDRQAVTSMPAVLGRAGLRIVRRSTPGAAPGA